MAQMPLSRQAALETVAAVNAALREGHPGPGTSGNHTPGAIRVAADRIGLDRGTMQTRLRSALRLYGWEPDYSGGGTKKPRVTVYPTSHDEPIAPPGYLVKGTSTLYNAVTGEPIVQWVKTTQDDEAREAALRAAVEAMQDDVPRLPPVPAPGRVADSLCNLYTLTDCHMGMLAWHKEGGADWDLVIAERVLTECFEQMVLSAPPARVGIVNQLGDFLHSDNLAPMTPTSGHLLDVDGRFSKIVGATIRVLRRIVDLALARHEEVHLILAEGNHDIASSVWLRIMFAALYENEPRLKVNDSELPYYVYRHGKTMLGFHHGHLKKNDSLPLTFAAMYPEMWGGTTKRYVHTGHRHHKDEREHAGVTICQHPTLAARDAYAARHGYLSERAALAITYHAVHGEVSRVTVTPEMLEAI